MVWLCRVKLQISMLSLHLLLCIRFCMLYVCSVLRMVLQACAQPWTSWVYGRRPLRCDSSNSSVLQEGEDFPLPRLRQVHDLHSTRQRKALFRPCAFCVISLQRSKHAAQMTQPVRHLFSWVAVASMLQRLFAELATAQVHARLRSFWQTLAALRQRFVRLCAATCSIRWEVSQMNTERSYMLSSQLNYHR